VDRPNHFFLEAVVTRHRDDGFATGVDDLPGGNERHLACAARRCRVVFARHQFQGLEIGPIDIELGDAVAIPDLMGDRAESSVGPDFVECCGYLSAGYFAVEFQQNNRFIVIPGNGVSHGSCIWKKPDLKKGCTRLEPYR
jgi:hypothetical protein